VTRYERPTHHAESRPWRKRIAQFCAIVVPILASVVARMVLAPDVVDWMSRSTHRSPTWMFTAGWATAGFAPAATLIFLLDGNRRARQVGDDPLNRPRAGHGHAVAGLGSGYWISRLPLMLVICIALVFAPSRGGSNVVDWRETPGGDSFGHGWHLSFLISLPALIALLVFQLLAFPHHKDRVLRAAGPLTAATPALALLGLYTSTR
jgi:hypothetical protein